MTGLVFTGGKAPAKEEILSILNNMQDNYVIAAADSGLDTAEKAGIKPDWIIGDMDSLSNPDCLNAYSKTQIIKYPKDKDFTDTELAFLLLKEKGCKDIWIIGGAGGRIDHLLAIFLMMERDLFPVRWICDNADIYCIDADSERNRKAEKSNNFNWLVKKNTLVSVFPIGFGPWQIKSYGLKWPLDKINWYKGFFGISNTVLEEQFSIVPVMGRFIFILQKSEEKNVSNNN